MKQALHPGLGEAQTVLNTRRLGWVFCVEDPACKENSIGKNRSLGPVPARHQDKAAGSVPQVGSVKHFSHL